MMRSDRDDFQAVLAWSFGGLIVSALVIGAVFSRLPSASVGEFLVERSLNNVDRQTCQRLLQGIREHSQAGAPVLWLWAEESTPGVFTGAGWGKSVVQADQPPRPYAFHPATQAAPSGTCAFPSNSVHMVSLETNPAPNDAIDMIGTP